MKYNKRNATGGKRRGADMGILSEEIKKKSVAVRWIKGGYAADGRPFWRRERRGMEIFHILKRYVRVYNGYIDAGSDIIQTNTFVQTGRPCKITGLPKNCMRSILKGRGLRSSAPKVKKCHGCGFCRTDRIVFQPAGDMTFESAVRDF